MRRVLLAVLVPALLAAGPTPNVTDLEARARDAFRAGDYTKAARLFGDILTALPAKDPTRPRTQYNRGRALQEAGRDCAAAEALFGYLSSPESKTSRESRRRGKAERYLERARAACDAQAAKRNAPPEPAPVEPRAVASTVRTGAPGAWLSHASLGTGVHLTDTPERARSTIQLGVGHATATRVFEVSAEIAIESPPGGSGLVVLRPGARFALSGPFYWRVSAPLLVEPLLAAGLHGGVGLVWPKDGQFALLAEAGTIGWLADPFQLTLDSRLGAQVRF